MRFIKYFGSMKKWLLFIGLCWVLNLSAQTGIGTTTPNASAKLDVYSDNKGFLPPRVSLTSATDNTTIPSPAEGLLVYNKGSVGLQAGYYYWNGANWATIATATSAGNGVTATDMVKLYQETYSTTTGKASSSSGYSFTVPVSGRYEFNFNCTGWNSNGSFVKLTFNIREGTNVIGTDYHQSASSNAWVEYEGRFEVNLTAGVTYNAQVVTTTGSRQAGYDWDKIMYKLVAGNLPVTGQSVDYVSVSRTGSDQTVNTGSTIIFNTNNGGNIPYNTSTGAFSLTAGKTYKLISGVSISNGNTAAKEVNFYWKNAAGDILGSKGEMLSPNANVEASGNGIAYAIYTPTINTTVSVIVSYSSTSTILWQNYTFASIEQIGSSAFVNPWVLSGNDVYNTTGVVGIGTSSPSASAILDLTSSSKGLLPPRVGLTAKSGTSSPIASPTTGLIVYNTASTGTGGDAVTPGYYYYNGTIWTRMDSEGWSTGVPITIGAVTTAPTKGTIVIDYVRYRNIGGKEYEVEYNFLQSSAGTTGAGDYLFTLPASLQFDFTVPGLKAYTDIAGYNGMKNRIASSQGDLLVTNFHSSTIAIPYDATRFRIMNNHWGDNSWLMHSPSNYAISDGSYGMKMTFRFKAL
jgi:hypothetical protein